MFHSDIQIRTAAVSDAQEILDIYAPYVRNTAITFEYEVPSLKEFEKRMQNTLEKYPYLVAVQNQEIVGYAYTGAFKGRAAYDWAVETSIYVRNDSRGLGAGGKLYASLEEISRAQHILNLNACIAYSEMEDEYLTKESVRFHAHLGYTMVGEFHKCGYKFGTWYNMVWMEKMIGEHIINPAPVIAFPELVSSANEKVGFI